MEQEILPIYYKLHSLNVENVKIIDINHIPNIVKLTDDEMKSYNDLFTKNIYITNSESTCFDILKLSLYVMIKLKLKHFIPVFPDNYDNYDDNSWFNFDDKYENYTFTIYDLKIPYVIKFYDEKCINTIDNQYYIGYNPKYINFNNKSLNKKNKMLIYSLGVICHEIGHYHIYQYNYEHNIENTNWCNCSPQDMMNWGCYLTGAIIGFIFCILIYHILDREDDLLIICYKYLLVLCIIIVMILSYFLETQRKDEIFCDYYSLKCFPIISKEMVKYYKKSSKSYKNMLVPISTHPSDDFRAKYFADKSLIEYNYPDVIDRYNKIKYPI